MASIESPAVARRRLRLALRAYRDDRGETQSQVADALEWSLSKIVRIEGGDVTISRGDLRDLLTFYGVSDPQVVERLAADARASRRRGWWTEPRYRSHLTPAMLQLYQFESEASTIRIFQNVLMPGLLQTESYATAVMAYWSDEVSEATRIARLEARQRRFVELFEGQSRPNYLLLLDESVLWRQIGGLSGPKIMAEQLQRLLTDIHAARVAVRVLPLLDPGAVAIVAAFTLIDIDAEGALLYREAQLTDEILQTKAEIARYRRTFDNIWENALSEDASVHLITARSSAVIASLDRHNSREAQ